MSSLTAERKEKCLKIMSSKYRKVEITQKKLQDIKMEAIGQTMVLTIAYLMDELGYDEDKCLDVWDGVARYADAVNSNLIKMEKICDIINEHTGLNIHWNKR